MSGDWGSHTEADAAAFERHYGDAYDDGPSGSQIAEMAAWDRQAERDRTAAACAAQERAA